MKFKALNTDNIYSLFETIGTNVDIFDLYRSSSFAIISSDKSAWPNFVFDINASRYDEFLVTEINERISKLDVKPLIISVDNTELDVSLRKSTDKFYPIEQWKGMYRVISHEDEFHENSLVDLYVLSTYDELSEWEKIVSDELFNGREIAREVLVYLMSIDHKLIAIKVDNSIIGTALIFKDKNNVAGIYLVCIKRELRGKGYGKMLVRFCLKLIKEDGTVVCILQSTKLGQKLYESMSFLPSNLYNLFWKKK